MILPHLLAVLTLASPPARSPRIGVSETFFNAQGLAEGLSCEYCPTNQSPLSRDSTKILIDVARSRGLSIFREIIPLGMLLPSQADTSRIDSLAKYLAGYRDTHSRVLVTLGMPVPAWVGSTHPWCPMAESDSAWSVVSSNLAWVFGGIVTRMLTIEGVTPSWIEQNLAFEPFNEFDALSTEECKTLTSHTQSSTPERAADLQRKIRAAIEALGVHPEITAPSITGVHSGTGFTNQDSSMAAWMERFYRAGGGGVPNLHVYRRIWNPDSPTSDLLAQFRTSMDIVTKSLPDSMQGRILLGETGVSVERDGCSTNTGYSVLPSSARATWYRTLATDSVIASRVDRILFWRLRSLPPGHIDQAPCESTYGLMLQDGTPDSAMLSLPPQADPTTTSSPRFHRPSSNPIILRYRSGKPNAVRLESNQFSPVQLHLFDTHGRLLWSNLISEGRWLALPRTLPSLMILQAGNHVRIVSSLERHP